MVKVQGFVPRLEGTTPVAIHQPLKSASWPERCDELALDGSPWSRAGLLYDVCELVGQEGMIRGSREYDVVAARKGIRLKVTG
jgi:hypothetical protein